MIIFAIQFIDDKEHEFFDEWVEEKVEEGEIELVEFNRYAVSDAIVK